MIYIVNHPQKPYWAIMLDSGLSLYLCDFNEAKNGEDALALAEKRDADRFDVCYESL